MKKKIEIQAQIDEIEISEVRKNPTAYTKGYMDGYLDALSWVLTGASNKKKQNERK